MNIQDPYRARDRLENLTVPEPNSGCLLWLGNIDRKGYGRIVIDKKLLFAHRVAFTILGARNLSPGLVLDHKCRVRCCVNPQHLEEVPSKENSMRGIGACAQNAKKTHCKNGHPLTGENLGGNGLGGRRCMTCKRQKNKEWLAKQKGTSL